MEKIQEKQCGREESLKELYRRMDKPQETMKFILVGGTNGKSSVAAYLASVLKCAGYKTGWYILMGEKNLRDRVWINGRRMTKQGISDCREAVLEAAEQLKEDGIEKFGNTELETAMVFLYLQRMGCDIVLLEMGYHEYEVHRWNHRKLQGRLNGRQEEEGGILQEALWDILLDILPVEAFIFTDISPDPLQCMGETPEEVAKYMLRFIRSGCPIISIEQSQNVKEALCQEAENLGCPIYEVHTKQITCIKYGLKKQRFTYDGRKDLEISVAGAFQIRNGALAVETIKWLESIGFFVTEHQLRKGLIQAKRQGCFTILEEKPYFIVDGACNEEAAKGLAWSMRCYFPKKRIIGIMGALRGSEYDKVLRAIFEMTEHMITITVPCTENAVHAYELAEEAKQYHNSVTLADSLEEAAELARLLAGKDGVILAFGFPDAGMMFTRKRISVVGRSGAANVGYPFI